MTSPEPFTMHVDRAELQKRSLFIAAPMFGGMCHGPYRSSCLGLTKMLLEWGIKHRFSDLYHESLIPRGRNYLADEFLRSDCTHMLFIDADIEFKPQDVMSLLAIDREIIGAPYPKKSINWQSVIDAVKAHPDIKPTDIERFASGFVFNLVKPGSINIGQLTEVMEIGTGYMMVKRNVFDLFAKQYPEQEYMPDSKGTASFSGDRAITAFFDCQIDRERVVESILDGEKRVCGGSNRYLSEDFFFCQWWRNMGGKIWLCPWMTSVHHGSYAYRGDLAAHAEFLGKVG